MTKEEWVEAKIQSLAFGDWYDKALKLAGLPRGHKLLALEGFTEMLLEEYNNDIYRAFEEEFEEAYTEYVKPWVYTRIKVGRGDDNLVLEYVDDTYSALDTWRLIDLDTGRVLCKDSCLNELISEIDEEIGEENREYVEEVIFPYPWLKEKRKLKEVDEEAK